MDDERSGKWLIEIFVSYQEAIDKRIKSETPQWLKVALDDDRKNRTPVRDSAARLDSL